MKLDKDTPTEMDLSFPVPEGGKYIWQILEGIDAPTNENTGKTTLHIPLQVDQAIEGNNDCVGMQARLFIPIETEFGEKQLGILLSGTGLIDSFIEKFGDDVKPLNDKFMAGLKLKLPGKFIQATHEVEKDQKERDRCRFLNFGAVASKGGTKSSPKGKKGGEIDKGEKEDTKEVAW